MGTWGISGQRRVRPIPPVVQVVAAEIPSKHHPELPQRLEFGRNLLTMSFLDPALSSRSSSWAAASASCSVRQKCPDRIQAAQLVVLLGRRLESRRPGICDHIEEFLLYIRKQCPISCKESTMGV